MAAKKEDKPYQGRGSKGYSRKIHFKLAKTVYNDWKKQGLNYSWNDAQKFASIYLFDEYKDDYVSKINKGEVTRISEKVDKNEFENALKIKFRKTKPGQLPPKLKVVPPAAIEDDAYDVMKVPEADILGIEWYSIGQVLAYLPNNLYIRINGGVEFGYTEIAKVEDLDYYSSGIDVIVSNVRDFVENSSGALWNGERFIRPGFSNDGKNSSYFIDFILELDGRQLTSPIDSVEGQITPLTDAEEEEREKRIKEGQEKIKKTKKKEEEAKKTRAKVEAAKKRERGKLKPADEKEKEERSKDILKMLELLKEDYKDGIYTKEEYKIEREKLISKLEKGGEI